jgi:hypothetical protein
MLLGECCPVIDPERAEQRRQRFQAKEATTITMCSG